MRRSTFSEATKLAEGGQRACSPLVRRFTPMIVRIDKTAVWTSLRRISPDGQDELVTGLRRVNDRLPQGWPIGLERDLLRRRFGALDLPVPVIRSTRAAAILYLDSSATSHLRRRPPSELAARHLWERLAAGPIEVPDLLAAAKLLGGLPRLRKEPMRTTPFASGHMLEYAAPDKVPARLAGLLRRVNAPPSGADPLIHATGVYFEALLIHPLPDGNGRLARLLFQAALQRTIELRAPVFPLGPACAINRPLLIASYFAWEFDGDAQPLVNFIRATLASLLRLYARSSGDSSAPHPPPM